MRADHEAIHSDLIEELDRLRNIRKARDSRDTGLLIMNNRPAIEQIQAVLCPTCGAEPGEKCDLHSGQPRKEPHRDRRLTAEDLLNS